MFTSGITDLNTLMKLHEIRQQKAAHVAEARALLAAADDRPRSIRELQKDPHFHELYAQLWSHLESGWSKHEG